MYSDQQGGSMKSRLYDVGIKLLIAAVPQQVDVKAIRGRLGMTQIEFCNAFGFRLETIKNWELNRRNPKGRARALLTLIDQNPAAARAALGMTGKDSR